MVRISLAFSACLSALGAALQGDGGRDLGAGAGRAETIEDDSQAVVDGGALEEVTQHLLRLRLQDLEAAQKLDEGSVALADAKDSGDANERGEDLLRDFELHRSHSSPSVAGDEDEETSDVLDSFDVSDFLLTDDFLDGGKPKKRVKSERQKKIEDLTGTLDEVIPRLEADFKVKTQLLKVALAKFKEKQHDMDAAKIQATLAMKALRTEAEKRRKIAWNRRAIKEREHKAKVEAQRTAKEAMIKKAQALMGVKGGSDGTLGDFSLGVMVDVLMALPAACESPVFNKRLAKSKESIMQSTQDFINITRRKTSKFMVVSSKASDVELSFILARFFHEASFRVKAMASDAQKVARDLNVVMPRELRQAFMPIIKGMLHNAVPLRVNASALAGSTLESACSEIAGIMANVTDYANKLNSMHTSMHNIWQLSELMLPKVDKIYPMKPIVIETVKDFMAMATNQIAGLSEASEEIVTNIGPIISERMQCTWNAALPRSRVSWVALLAALACYLFV